MVNCSDWPVVEITATLCGAGASPPPGAVKLRVFAESNALTPAGLIVSENGLVVVALMLSVTRMANEKVPAACGVPLKVPPAPSSDRPPGRVPESRVQVSGGYPPLAARVTE